MKYAMRDQPTSNLAQPMPFEQGEAIPFGQHGRPACGTSCPQQVAGYLASSGILGDTL